MVRDCQATAAAWFHTSSSGVIYGHDIKARNDPVESGSVNLADVWARHQGKKWPHVIRLHQARRRRHGCVHVHAPIRLCSVADLWGPLVQQISERVCDLKEGEQCVLWILKARVMRPNLRLVRWTRATCSGDHIRPVQSSEAARTGSTWRKIGR